MRRLLNIVISAVISTIVRTRSNPEKRNIHLGRDVNFYGQYSIHAGSGQIIIGDRCSFNTGLFMDADFMSEISIGNDVNVGPYAAIIPSTHNYNRTDIPINKQGHTPGKIKIRDDVWVGSHVTILKDVVIGEGSIIAAGAVVIRDVEPYSIVGGVPANLIRKRK